MISLVFALSMRAARSIGCPCRTERIKKTKKKEPHDESTPSTYYLAGYLNPSTQSQNTETTAPDPEFAYRV